MSWNARRKKERRPRSIIVNLQSVIKTSITRHFGTRIFAIRSCAPAKVMEIFKRNMYRFEQCKKLLWKWLTICTIMWNTELSCGSSPFKQRLGRRSLDPFFKGIMIRMATFPGHNTFRMCQSYLKDSWALIMLRGVSLSDSWSELSSSYLS